jgi:DedD protein
MKLTMDERVKHRMVGLAVILSVVAIFLPAILKRTNQPFDNMSRVSVRLPTKPAMPEVQMVEEARLFKTIKVAHVQVQRVPTQAQVAVVSKPVSLAKKESSPRIEVAQVNLPKAHSEGNTGHKMQNATKHVEASKASLSHSRRIETALRASVLPPAPQITKRNDVAAKLTVRHAPQPASVHQLAHLSSAPAAIEKSLLTKNRNAFAVQVANFSSLENATTLTSKLKAKGFKAHYTRIHSSRGVNYKVLVGHSIKRDDVVRIQQALASQLQLKGFVVDAEVG